MRVGILALQGAFAEHKRSLERLGAGMFEIRQKKDLEQPFDALVLPGGESTVIGQLMRKLDLLEPIKTLIKNGMPVLGTCAGLILLAKNVEGGEECIGAMDISVRRNAYGRQIDSFSQSAVIEKISPEPIPLVFIRAPWIESVGKDVEVLLRLDGHIVAAKQDNMLVTSFHPELTEDLRVHKYFLDGIDTSRSSGL